MLAARPLHAVVRQRPSLRLLAWRFLIGSITATLDEYVCAAMNECVPLLPILDWGVQRVFLNLDHKPTLG